MLFNSITFILLSILSTRPCHVRAHGYAFGQQPVKMNVFSAQTSDLQQQLVLLTESPQDDSKTTKIENENELPPGITEAPILSNPEDDYEEYWRLSAAAEFSSFPPVAQQFEIRAIQAASSTTSNTADRVATSSGAKSGSITTTKTTTTTSQVKTSVWVTLTSGATVITTQEYYTQSFDQIYSSLYTPTSGSIGLGSISGTVGTQRSYLTTEDNENSGNNNFLISKNSLLFSFIAPSILLIITLML